LSSPFNVPLQGDPAFELEFERSAQENLVENFGEGTVSQVTGRDRN
jgi:hypothetical protein